MLWFKKFLSNTNNEAYFGVFFGWASGSDPFVGNSVKVFVRLDERNFIAKDASDSASGDH